MTVMAVTISREALERRRAEILVQLGLSLAAYRRLRDRDAFGPVEWEFRDELAEIDFLLDEAS